MRSFQRWDADASPGIADRNARLEQWHLGSTRVDWVAVRTKAALAREARLGACIGRLNANRDSGSDVLRYLDRQIAQTMKQGGVSGRARKEISNPLMMPGAPSSRSPDSGSLSPSRSFFMSSKNAVTVSVSSFSSPPSRCSSTRRPSTVKREAARTGSRLAPGRSRSAMPSTNR